MREGAVQSGIDTVAGFWNFRGALRTFLVGAIVSLLSIVAADAEKILATGTGFAISPDGYIVTNEHVVGGCSTVRITKGGEIANARIVTSDKRLDLALLKVGFATPAFAALRQSPPLRFGDEAITFGYPLVGALTVDGNLTSGNVSALRGLSDNTTNIQITTPVQAGNSGGALVDKSANVIGVVASKLNTLRMLQATGDVPQNVNFAVSLEALRLFLNRTGIVPQEAVSLTPLSTADVGEKAQKFTFLIICEGQQKPKAPKAADAPVSQPTQVDGYQDYKFGMTLEQARIINPAAAYTKCNYVGVVACLEYPTTISAFPAKVVVQFTGAPPLLTQVVISFDALNEPVRFPCSMVATELTKLLAAKYGRQPFTDQFDTTWAFANGSSVKLSAMCLGNKGMNIIVYRPSNPL
jgi:hypothetical protein